MQQRLTRRLPYTSRQLFDLVADVERYPDFVPWVSAMRTWDRCEIAPGVATLKAEARVGFSIVRERFVTRVRLDAPNGAIDVALISGPFRRLNTTWRFAPTDAGAEVGFVIDFEFGSRLLERLLAANASKAIGRLMACFEARARALYGAASAVAP